ncbi:chromosome segregation protein SMC [Verticiella sediminum]|uniref:Chromosome partition protein Smc n=1 Tax=Verticiella sediminum TaxID=1247510 RepID=A0A556ABN6_9BURK|nr:chromosome segregation protein SMC [Verticiella sediminum]TSH90316.1 chromosome segregation protein SMC [Verticiella sediminum]
MRLTQIKLAGFKSFVDPTSIQVPSQLVGVVGPNGCGKSNIIDAVRWVLGETRASELRGESMQDVIFNGSGNRKPAARASVELVFDNEAGRAAGQWSQYAEIAVKRVLTRDGASSYFVNNQPVRRRDIHDIFLGTGLGARGYAIIGQGMISRIIEARPEELRVFLEEAAGVSRYKERRRETGNRLEDTRENLTRVEDILRELTAQLEKLEAQAAVAQRYQSLQAEGERKLHALWLLRKREADETRERSALETERAQTDLEAAIAGLRRDQSQLESLRQAHYAAGDAVHAMQGRLFEANTEVSRLEAEIRYVVEARNRLQQRREQLEQQIRTAAEEIEDGQARIVEAEDEREAAAVRTEEAKARLYDVQDAQPAQEARLREAQVSLSALRGEVAQVEQALALSAQTQREADRQLQQLALRRERLEQQAQALTRPDTGRIAQLAGDLAAAAALVEDAEGELQALEERVPRMDAERREAQQAAQEQAGAVNATEARLGALTRLQQDVQQQGELQPWLQKHELTQRERLWQRLQIEPGWETALESVLRERMSALEMNQLDWASGFLTDAPPARMAFYQMPVPQAAPNVPGGFTPLTALLRISDPRLRTLMNAWLRDTYVMDDAAQALRARASLPAGAAFVTREGHLIDNHGVRFYAPDTEQAGMLARQQEIENLQREVKAKQLIADESRTAASRAEAAYSQVAAALPGARQRLAEVTARRHALHLEHERLVHEAQQSGAESERIAQDLEELRVQEEELRASREEAEARFETLDGELGDKQSRVADAEIALESLAADVERARTQLRDSERASHEAEFAERGAAARIGELQRSLQRLAEQVERAREELAGVSEELVVLDDAAAQAGLQEALAARAECEDAVARARAELDDLNAQLRAADEARQTAERSLEPQRERITQLQLQEQAARLAQEQFQQQLTEAEVNEADVAAWLDENPAERRRVTWLQAEVQRVTREVNGLGAVNLAALEELNTARERQGFLASQQQDLVAAIETLEDAIRRIDRETRQLLQETFDTVNGHFGELFPRLFGGGEARLSMTGEEILDAGVQVMAQPPGKRNSTIHLLSGGEKALTATALVFALFKLNPAPFCLLDEVDAPLDDANTERYANLVRSMSEQTQFLFISHNKIAMEMAHQLVGVTMQELGVSRIVAVDIDAAIQLTAEAA